MEKNIGENYGGNQLLALEHLAAGHDAEVQQSYAIPDDSNPAGEGVEQPIYNPSIEAECLLKTARELLGPVYPCLRRVYTDETIARIADAAGPVMTKYGWTAGGFFEQWGPEIQLAGVLLPVGIATVSAIKQENAMIAAMREAQGNQPGQHSSKGAVAHGEPQGEAAAAAE
ncbi:hypothetical protein [Chitinilyticum aquatile]|uniref:hypothetical protein n=1 Tax=Chitinilyticum aquatile TaxID=362520 RepID=UPI0003F83464|nr:hypothetical protein [Chitinilyticum aquatile]